MKIRLLIIFVLLMSLGMLIGCSCGDDDDDDELDDDDDDDNDTGSDDDDDDNDDDDDDDDNDSSSGDVWTDSTTGYMWQNGYPVQHNWEDAKTYCNNLDWGGYTDWHLPTISELRSLIRGCDATATGGSCGVTDSCLAYDTCWNVTCWECDEGQGPANGNFWPSELVGPAGWYWSSSDVTDYANWAWAIPFFGGDIDGYDTAVTEYVRCMR